MQYMIKYLHRVLQHARFTALPDGSVEGAIPAFPSVHAHAPSLEECRWLLEVALARTIVEALHAEQPLPTLADIAVEPYEQALV
ncbi:MAG: hypothetical protein M3R24_18310 [Chloroflexota bacterium]|nr:hypothetical protein [Chloroflexota bacterium]